MEQLNLFTDDFSAYWRGKDNILHMISVGDAIFPDDAREAVFQHLVETKEEYKIPILVSVKGGKG